MRKLPIFTLLLSLLSGIILGQCPTASFTLPDSICAGEPFNITNTSTNGNFSYLYDFCPGDLESSPNSNFVGNYSGVLNSGLGTDLAFDGVNYYQFICSNGGSLQRLNYGNSINNVPTIDNLGNFGGLASGLGDIKIILDNGSWYGFACSSNSKFIRFDIGADLSSNTITAVLINSSNLLNSPYYMDFYSQSGNYYAALVNTGTSSIVTFDFGGNILNLNPFLNSINLPGIVVSASIKVQCDSIYLFASYLSNTNVDRLDFGNSILNPNPILRTLNTIGVLSTNSREIEILSDNGNYYGFIVNSPGNELSLLKFGDNLLNLSPTVISLGSVGGAFTSADYGFIIKKINSEIIGFSVGFVSGNVNKFHFPNLFLETTQTSNLPSPQNIVLLGEGYRHIELMITDSTGSYLYQDSIFINPIPLVSFTISPTCRNTDVEFNDNSTISIGNLINNDWSFGDNTNSSGLSVSHVYIIGGIYNVVLTTTSDKGCSSTDSMLINVVDNPIANFSFTDSLCALSDVIFTDASSAAVGTINNWMWSFGDSGNDSIQNPNHTYINDGIFNVQLVVTQTNGCKDSIIKAVNVIPTPKSGFSIFNTCVNETANFINTTTINGSSTLTYNWDFGDSNSSTLTNPTNTYPNTPSNYDVKLITLASNGCTDTIQENIRIGEKPVPNFSVNKDTACVGNVIQFTNSSTIASGDTISKYYWDFGDSVVDSLNTNTTHEYLLPGTYTVSLRAFSPTYCDSTITKDIVVIDSPTSNFTSSDVCLGLNTPFTDISTTPTGSVLTSWNWNFGDTNSSNQQNTNNTYLLAGIYDVTLVVTNSAGCYDSTTKPVLVYSKPQPKFGFTKACTDKEVIFTDSSTVNNSTIVAWNWNFGDNSGTSITQNTNHIYTASAAYPVTLIATSAFGCVDSLIKYILVDQSPQFNITASDTCFRLSNKFTYIPIGAPLPTANFLWNFGDSTFAFQSNPNHLYTQPGSYPVSLLVTDLNTGCNTQINDTVSVYALPKSEFSVQNSCINDSLQFTDLSTTSSGTISSWKWLLGSYGNSTLQNPVIVINAADSFIVKQVVTSNFGCKDSSSSYAVVYPLPLVSFTQNVSYGGPPLLVNFTNTSNASQYEWNFGDGSSLSTQINPTHVYNSIGNYNTTLIATSSKGCIDSSSTTITVLNPALDLALEAISYTETNGLWEIKCKVRNLGNLDINSFTLSAQLDGKSQISETSENLVLVAGQSIDFIFSSKFLANDSDNPNFLCVKVVDVNAITDDSQSNDSRCVTTSKDYEVFEAYPNPFNQDINIGINAPNSETVSISIFSIDGKKIMNDSLYELQKGFNTISIENLNLLSGIYFLQILQGENSTVKKLMKN